MNQNQFDSYLKNTFKPAWDWAHTQKGVAFLQNSIPSLYALRSREDDVAAAVYLVKINGKPVYVGQSLRTVRRLYVHAMHLMADPLTFFGIKAEEIYSIEMEILSGPIFKESVRLSVEEAMVKHYKPILQPYYNIPGMRADTCLPRAARRAAMVNAGAVK